MKQECWACARPTLFLWMSISNQATVQEEAKKRQPPRLLEGLGLVASPVTLQLTSTCFTSVFSEDYCFCLLLTIPWKVSRWKHVTSLNLTVLHFSDLVGIVVILESIQTISKTPLQIFLLMPRTSLKGHLHIMYGQHKNNKSPNIKEKCTSACLAGTHTSTCTHTHCPGYVHQRKVVDTALWGLNLV